MDIKDYTLTCGEVIDNLLYMADAYEKASAGKAPNGFAFNPTDAAANIKAAVHFIVGFGKQVPQWIPVEDRLPEDREQCLVAHAGSYGIAWWHSTPPQFIHEDIDIGWKPTHWMPLPEPPEATT